MELGKIDTTFGTVAVSPLADAEVAVDREGRVVAVIAPPGGRLAEVIAGAGAVEAEADLQVNIVGASGIPVRLVARASGADGVLRLILQDLRPVAEMRALADRAVRALEEDRAGTRAVEARLHAMLSAAESAVVMIDGATGRILEISGPAGRMLGGTPASLVGSAFTQFFEGRRRSAFLDTLTTAALQGGETGVAVRLRQSGRTVALRPTLIRSDRHVALMIRIDGSEGAPRGSGSTVARLCEASAAGIVCVDGENRIAWANDAFRGLVGAATVGDVTGRDIADFLGRGLVDLRALRAGDAPTRFATGLVGQVGSPRPIEIVATALPGGDLGLIVHDVSVATVLRPDPREDRPDAPDASALVGTVPLREIIATATDGIERACIAAAIAQTDGNRAAAAEMLGLSRQSLYVKLRRYDLAGRERD